MMFIPAAENPKYEAVPHPQARKIHFVYPA
jgi:hypothetical protein